MSLDPESFDAPCALCGADPAAGFACAGTPEKMVRLCHPDDPRARDCYSEWTFRNAAMKSSWLRFGDDGR